MVNFAVSSPAHFSHSQVFADQTECKRLKGSQLLGIQPEMWNKPQKARLEQDKKAAFIKESKTWDCF